MALINQRNFWRFWLGGILIFAVMVALNPSLSVAGVEGGIPDHQTAGSAERVDAIHAAWQAAGLIDLARFSMALDLLFIAVYSLGAFCGGVLFRGMPSRAMRRLGAVIMVAAVIFLLSDYAETVCQFIQIISLQGSDWLAAIAAYANMPKTISFLVTFVGILAGLFLQGRLNRAAD